MCSLLVRLYAVQLTLLASCWGFQWTSDLPDGTVKYACVGDELVLPWSYKTSPGDDIISIQWFSLGESQRMVAMYSQGNFAPMASFANRVQHLSGAGLSLSHVTSGDTGNYSVEISGHDASGTFFEYRRTVMVQVAENDTLMTSDGELYAMLEPHAIYSNRTGQWSLVVSCGRFTYRGDPPFDMEWTTPSSVVPLQSSTGYKDGYFQLHVTSGGDYTCRIPQHAASDVCLRNSTLHATVHVDKMEARMTLMEARQQQLEKENEDLTQSLQQGQQREANLTDYVHTLESRLTQSMQQAQQREANLTDYVYTLESRLDNENSNLRQSLQQARQREANLTDYVHILESRLDNKDTSLTDYVHTLESRLDNKDVLLTQSLQQAQQREANLSDYVHTLESRLDNKDSSLTQSLQTLAALSGKGSRQVAFTARLGHGHTSGIVKFDVIINNYGNGYSSSSGYFTAPVDGLYFFVLTSVPETNDVKPNAYIYKAGSVLTITGTNTGMPGKVASCGAAVHLTAGETVSVWSSYQLTNLYTSFSGFLVTSD